MWGQPGDSGRLHGRQGVACGLERAARHHAEGLASKAYELYLHVDARHVYDLLADPHNAQQEVREHHPNDYHEQAENARDCEGLESDVVRQLDPVSADGPGYHSLHPHVQAHATGHHEVGVQLGDGQTAQGVEAEEPTGPEEVGHPVHHVQGALDHLGPRQEPQVSGYAALGQVPGGVLGAPTAAAPASTSATAAVGLKAHVQYLFRGGVAQVVGLALPA